MNFLSDKELLLSAFTDFLRNEAEFRNTKVDEYGKAARQFVEYLQRQPEGHQWLRIVRDEQTALDFVNLEFETATEETRNKKRVALQKFQEYIRMHGRLAW